MEKDLEILSKLRFTQYVSSISVASTCLSSRTIARIFPSTSSGRRGSGICQKKNATRLNLRWGSEDNAPTFFDQMLQESCPRLRLSTYLATGTAGWDPAYFGTLPNASTPVTNSASRPTRTSGAMPMPRRRSGTPWKSWRGRARRFTPTGSSSKTENNSTRRSPTTTSSSSSRAS